MIVVDELQTYPLEKIKPAARRYGRRWCHLMSDGSLDELHAFAAVIGLQRSWFQDHATLGHYDLTPSLRRRAVLQGAVEVRTTEWLQGKWLQQRIARAEQPELLGTSPAISGTTSAVPCQPGVFYPLGYRTPGSDLYLEQLMADEHTVIVECRYTPFAYHRPHWCRFGERGLTATWGSRYHYYSDRTQFPGGGNDLNWLGNRFYKQADRDIMLVHEQRGLERLQHLLTTGWNVIGVCGCVAEQYESCHLKFIADALQRMTYGLRVQLQPGLVSLW